MMIEQGQIIKYADGAWNIEGKFGKCKNQRLLSVKNNEKQIIDINCFEKKIEVIILFDARETPIKLIGFPKDFDNISILICNTQNRIALYIDETLQDEDWPIGKVEMDGGVCDTVSGEWTIHGDFSFNQNYREPYAKITNVQNWRPSGHNTGAGDCMPFYHEGIFHLFYLFDRRGHRSKWNLGAHQWAHISTKDFITWEEHPMAISIDEQYEGSICTGSVIFYKGLYYAFYAVRMSDGSPARLSWSTSEDCIHFVKSNKYYELAQPYDSPSARDPMVIVDGEGIAHMFVTTSIRKGNDHKGCLAHMTSSDMENWTTLPEPLVVMDNGNQPECTDYFFFKGWYYLIYSNYGTARYFMSKNPFGPWEAPENNIIIKSGCTVPKTAKFGEDRVMAAGFIITQPGRNYAGEVYFNEMIQEQDGTFKFIVPEELSR